MNTVRIVINLPGLSTSSSIIQPTNQQLTIDTVITSTLWRLAMTQAFRDEHCLPPFNAATSLSRPPKELPSLVMKHTVVTVVEIYVYISIYTIYLHIVVE